MKSSTKLNRQSVSLHGQRDISLKTVLFATDFSPACNNAWPYAIGIARQYRSRLLLVHVIAPAIFASVPPELMTAARDRARVDAEAKLAYLQRLRVAAGIEPEGLLAEGDVAGTLLGLIDDHDVDLLVTATRARRDLKRLLLGSVAEKLFRQVNCPVLVVPKRARVGRDNVQRILYPTDFSSESSRARSYAVSLARHYRAQLVALHVVGNAEFKSAEEMAGDRTGVEDRLRDLFRPDLGFASEVHLEVAFGAPARNISRIAADYQVDLVVIGVHPAGATTAHEEERTAYQVIRWSHCPVLTIPKDRRIRKKKEYLENEPLIA
jgi:nucleotide-binding universal stress UspA family protein